MQFDCFGSARGSPTQKPEWVAILALEYFPLVKSMAVTLLGLFCELLHKGKGKAIPFQTWTVTEGSRRLRVPGSRHSAHEGGQIVSPML